MVGELELAWEVRIVLIPLLLNLSALGPLYSLLLVKMLFSSFLLTFGKIEGWLGSRVGLGSEDCPYPSHFVPSTLPPPSNYACSSFLLTSWEGRGEEVQRELGNGEGGK